MGLLDRFAQVVANRIDKAPNLPSGSVTLSEGQMSVGMQSAQYGNTNAALPRDPITPNVPFSPGQAILPGPINPSTDRGRPDPRRYEYQVAQNINVTETRTVPFKTLRAAAEQIDIVRRCVEVMKLKMVGLDWDITLGTDAAEKIMTEQSVSQIRAQVAAKQQYAEDIHRVRSFWEQPDPSNGLIFADWLNMALEEILVIDGWAVWPQKTVGGDLYGLQILDGTTIKPLLDDRGMRPMPPYPAYQQILFGFPRSEFSAPTETFETDGEFTSDELSYMVRNRRTMSVYGLSPVERVLPLADLYLRRQQWMRKEYTDGVLPELMFETDANFGSNPELLKAYENIFNDDLAGQTDQRVRARILPGGLKPVQFDSYGERFKDTLDEYLITSICGHFGLQPTEIGFATKGGLGGTGTQEGQAASSENIGMVPLANWVGKMLTHLSYVYLGMPRELEFTFMPSSRKDTLELATKTDIEIKHGGKTLNEARSEYGLPLLDAVEADYPMVLAGAAPFFITPDGVKPIIEAPNPFAELMGGGEQEAPSEIEAPKPALVETAQDESATEAKPVTETEEETAAAQQAEYQKSGSGEMRIFLKWLKHPRARAFNFEIVEPGYAETINKFMKAKDYDSARWYAELYLGE
jgi:hypothetical protein